jgi:hypothetical protein
MYIEISIKTNFLILLNYKMFIKTVAIKQENIKGQRP